MDKYENTVQMLIGQDHIPLAYLIGEVATVPITTDDLIINKCYSATNKSLIEELVARKSHDSACVETNKILLFNRLDKALQNGPQESAIQAHESNKDSQAVMKTIMVQHGGKGMQKKLHEKLIHSLKIKWKSTVNITLTEHIAKFRGNVAKIVRVCAYCTYWA